MTTESLKLSDMPEYLKQVINLANLNKSRSQIAWIVINNEGGITSGSNLLGYPINTLIEILKFSNSPKQLFLSCQPFPQCMTEEDFIQLIQKTNVTEAHMITSDHFSGSSHQITLNNVFCYDLAEFNQASIFAVKVSREKQRPWVVAMISGNIQGGYSEPAYFLDDPTGNYLLNERLAVTQAVISDDKSLLQKLSQSKNSDNIELLLNFADSTDEITRILKQLYTFNIFSVLVMINPETLNLLIKQGPVDELIVNCNYTKLNSRSQNTWEFFEHLSDWYLSGHHNLNGDTVMNYIKT